MRKQERERENDSSECVSLLLQLLWDVLNKASLFISRTACFSSPFPFNTFSFSFLFLFHFFPTLFTPFSSHFSSILSYSLLLFPFFFSFVIYPVSHTMLVSRVSNLIFFPFLPRLFFFPLCLIYLVFLFTSPSHFPIYKTNVICNLQFPLFLFSYAHLPIHSSHFFSSPFLPL